MHKRGHGGRRDDDPDVQISKNLSYLLRHGALKEGLNIDTAGFVLLDEILGKQWYKSRKVGVDKIKHIVDTNEKKRFELKTQPDATGTPVLYIRATQGHSLQVVDDEGLLEKVEDPSKIPLCIHGTFNEAWESIKKSGLKTMTRNHVHFAVGYPGESGVISGMRKTCSVFIELDVEKCMKEGIELFVSKNNVVLSRGIDGVIPPEYFKKVIKNVKGTLTEVDPREYKSASTTAPKTGNTGNMAEEMKEEGKVIESSEATKPKTKSAAQHFKYLCVLDFEAQCIKGQRLDVQEIVEFPVVIVDVENKTILEDKFHYYVKPVVHPKLYPFCTELTGITQDKVDKGIVLPIVLGKLDEFLKEKKILDSKFCFVTCGDWDLKTCLKNEAAAKTINVRDYLKKWINLKQYYPVPLGSKVVKPDMVEMLNLSGLDLIGKHHSGIDDANNIARVVIYLLQKNFSFRESMVASY